MVTFLCAAVSSEQDMNEAAISPLSLRGITVFAQFYHVLST